MGALYKPYLFILQIIKYTEANIRKEWAPIKSKIPEWKVYFDGNFWGHHDRELRMENMLSGLIDGLNLVKADSCAV